MNIIGKYEYTINFQNMFVNYKIKLKNKNLIVFNGRQFFLKRIWDDNVKISKICFGTGTNPPQLSNTDLQHETGYTTDITSTTDSEKITLRAEVIGEKIDDTTEIGVKYIENSTEKLISRDVYEKIVVPTSAIITIEYIYKITINTGE